jgi:hypothetical protein
LPPQDRFEFFCYREGPSNLANIRKLAQIGRRISAKGGKELTATSVIWKMMYRA